MRLEIGLDQHPVKGRRRTERRHLVPADDRQDGVRVGLAQRDLHHAGPLMPLAKQSAPRRLGPAGIGDRPMAVAGAQVLPEPRGGHVTQSVRLGMHHHLRIRNCAAGEKHQHRIVASGGVGRGRAVAGAIQERIEVVPRSESGALLRPQDAMAHGGEFSSDLIGLRGALLVGDYRDRLGGIDAIANVPRRGQIRSGRRDGANPDGAKHRGVPGRNPRQHHHYPVAPADAQIRQGARHVAGLCRQRGYTLLGDQLSASADRNQGRRVRVLGAPSFDDIQDRVEAFGHLHPVAGALLLVGFHARLGLAIG